MPDLNLARLKPDVAAVCGPFAEDILSAQKENIHSIYIVGSAVTDDFAPGKSDINTVFVLKKMDFGFLETLSSMGKKYGKKKIAAPLVMTPEYVANSTDVFPVEFLTFKLIHETIYGEDALSGIEIKKEHLRHQCEREIKVKLIGLRQGYISSLGDSKALSENFARLITGYMPLFRGIVFLKGSVPPMLYNDVLRALSDSTNVDCAVFRDVLNVKRERAKLPVNALKEVFKEYYLATERLVKVVDEIAI